MGAQTTRTLTTHTWIGGIRSGDALQPEPQRATLSLTASAAWGSARSSFSPGVRTHGLQKPSDLQDSKRKPRTKNVSGATGLNSDLARALGTGKGKGGGCRARAEVEGARGRAGPRAPWAAGTGRGWGMRGDGTGTARAAGRGCARADVLGCVRSWRSPWYPWQDDRFGVAARLYLALADLRTPAALAPHKQNGSA